MAAAMSSRCCLNLPPLADSNSIHVIKSITSRVESDEKAYKKRNPKIVTGLACAIIALEIAITPIAVPNIDLNTHQVSTPKKTDIAMATEMKSRSSTKGSKWSDKRRCPSWNMNALETIVPENLPRPLAHRRWEAVAYDSFGHIIAPDLKTEVIVAKAKIGCFSM